MNNLFCKFCKKNYSSTFNFKTHLKKFHPKIYAESELSKTKPRFDQKCPLCDFCSKIRKHVEKHLRDVHKIEEVSSCKVLCFLTNDEFLKWKKDIEKSTNTVFIQPCGSQRSKNVKTTYFYCSRSGYFAPKGDGKRSLRTQGSSKINSVCPAKIKKLEKDNDGIEVHYSDTHLGHTNDLEHLHLQKEERDEIALKIAQNIPFESILQEIKKSAETGEKIERLRLLTKKDLWNIKYSYTASGMLSRMSSISSELKKDNSSVKNDAPNSYGDENKSNGDEIGNAQPENYILEYEEIIADRSKFLNDLNSVMKSISKHEYDTEVLAKGSVIS